MKNYSKFIPKFILKSPAYLAAFGILHEVTAIVPLPIFYFALQKYPLPISPDLLQDASQIINRVALRNGWELDARTIVHFAASYALVKLLFPVRMAASIALTPWFAGAILRVTSRWSLLRQKR